MRRNGRVRVRGVRGWLTCLFVLVVPVTGIQQLFGSLIDAIIAKKDQIERENELKKRDSVLLSSTSTPVWAAQADQ